MPAHTITPRAARSTGLGEPEKPTWGELHPAFIDVQRAVALAGDGLTKKHVILDAADRFWPLIRCGQVRLQDAIDGLCDVGRNHGLLTKYIEAEIGHRLRGEIDGWRAAAIEYHQHRGPDRTDAPPIVAGGSPESDAAWAAWERRERERGGSMTEHQRSLRGLLEEDVSLDRAYAAIQERRQTPPPQSTIDAFWFLARQGDPARLEDWLARHTAEEVAHLRRLLEVGL